MEAAKLRAARLMWARIMREFAPKKSSSLMLRTHCQTSGVSLQEQDPYNNIVRTAFEAMSAVLGGTQSLHTNSFDEAIALPTEFSSRIARNTQLILEHETGVTKVVDPLAGSYYIESLTADLADRGPPPRAEGFPKRLIEEAATRRQAAVDRGEEIVVGVNRYRLEEEQPIDIRDIDNVAVRKEQVARLQQLRDGRNGGEVERRLGALTELARSGTGNILAAAVEAARARATVGEISDALRQVFGDHAAVPQVVRGIYGPAYNDDPEFGALVGRLRDWSEGAGHAPRIMIAKLGQDGHDRGAKIIASAFGDLGFDVVTGPLFQLPDEAADLAVTHKVQVVGISSLAAGHRSLAPELVAALRARGANDVIVIIGGVIPRQDYEFLLGSGIAGIFGPGTNVLDAANAVIDLLEGRRRNHPD